MTIETILQNISAGGVVSVIVLILGLIEITPIKVSPLQWIGKRCNKETIDKMTSLDKKLNEHIAQSNRNKIFAFQNDLLGGELKTKEEFDECIEAITEYTKFCHDNEIKNDKCNLAIEYIERIYKYCQDNRSFANVQKKED